MGIEYLGSLDSRVFYFEGFLTAFSASRNTRSPPSSTTRPNISLSFNQDYLLSLYTADSLLKTQDASFATIAKMSTTKSPTTTTTTTISSTPKSKNKSPAPSLHEEEFTTQTHSQSQSHISNHFSHHQIKVRDFAPGTLVTSTGNSEGLSAIERKRSLRKRIQVLVWNPRAKYSRRGKLMEMMG